MRSENIGMKRLLLIENSETYRTLWAWFFTEQGFEVRTARSGEEGLARLDSGEPFDLIILDLHIRGMDGFAVLEALREISGATPVLAVADEFPSGVDLLPAAKALGAAKAFRKPVATQILLKEIAAILNWHPQELPLRDLAT